MRRFASSGYVRLNAIHLETTQPFFNAFDFKVGLVLIVSVLVLNWFHWGSLLTGIIGLSVIYFFYGYLIPYPLLTTPQYDPEFVMNYLGLGTNEGLFWFLREAADSIWFLVIFAGALFAVGTLADGDRGRQGRRQSRRRRRGIPGDHRQRHRGRNHGHGRVQRRAHRPLHHSDDEEQRLQRVDGRRDRGDRRHGRPDHAAGARPRRLHHRGLAEHALRRHRARGRNSRPALHDWRDFGSSCLCASQSAAETDRSQSTSD